MSTGASKWKKLNLGCSRQMQASETYPIEQRKRSQKKKEIQDLSYALT